MRSNHSRRAVLRAAIGAAGAAAVPFLTERGISAANAVPTAQTPSSNQIRYVSAAGNDGNDGLTPHTAWATINTANSQLPSERSTLLFRRGDTFYGELSLPFGCEVGAYGSGDKPVLTMYKLLNRPGSWVEHSNGIWSIDLSSPDTHDGYTASTDSNIGFLLVDGAIKPNLKLDRQSLDATWDFACDMQNHMLYVKAPGNPALLVQDIRAAPHGDLGGVGGGVLRCEQGSNDVHDVHITGSGSCGITGSAADVRIHDCLIDYIGGSQLLALDPSGATRYGNGIANWVNVARWMIENNEIAHVYDVAWSPQGMDAQDGPVSWQDLTFRNNYVHDCCQSVEFWSQSSNPKSAGFVRIVVEGNRFERAGYGPFADSRPNQWARVHLLTYHLETPVDVTIQNNRFVDSFGAFSFHQIEPPAGYVTRNNTISLRAGRKLEYQRPETIADAAAWQAATGRETGSIFSVLP